MDWSSKLFKDSLFNDLSIKKDSMKNLNKASGKQLIEKSQFLNYKHNCKVMNEAKKSLSGKVSESYCNLNEAYR